MILTAKKSQYSSVVGQSVSLHGPTGIVVAQVMIAVPNQPPFEYKKVAPPIVERISQLWSAPVSVPEKEGFYWGRWTKKGPGTADPDDPPNDQEWEVMHVVQNSLDAKDLMVMVPGVEKWQPLENFIWGREIPPCDSGSEGARQ
jgi:hypothetical protein